MVNENLQEGELVLGTVEKIIGTTVFVKIGEEREGTITLSEIAPGRIRNLRDYVVPGKRIVCKVLSVRENSVHLSLRRVGINEKKDFLQKVDKEKSNRAIIKTVAGEKELENIIRNINNNTSITDLFESAKKDPKILEKYMSKENAEKILKILESKKEKPKEIRKIFRLSSSSQSGIKVVKDIIQSSCKNSKCKISYLAAGKYSLSIEGSDLKEIQNEINNILKNIEVLAKKSKSEFSAEKD